MKDRYGRSIEYMRISVTDRCDLRCKYCMPEEGVSKVDRSEILSSEEIIKVCEASIKLGIDKFKITGGEPLLRYDLERLLSGMRDLEGLKEITMTTNAQRLGQYLDRIAEIGIDGINISLDTLKADKYADITRLGDIDKVFEAIDSCLEKGIKTKINCLVQRGFNEDEIVNLAEFAMDKGVDIRFIELMPIGFAKPENSMTSEEVLESLHEAYPELEADNAKHGNGPAVYYKVPGRKSAIGIIRSVSGMFCESCNRVRLTSMGYIKPCLCYDSGVYIRPEIAAGDRELEDAIKAAIESKPEHHSFRDPEQVDHHAMSAIGG